jgi:protein-disulfide isomerase
MAGRVDSDVASGNDSGVEGTPATFINGQLVSGAVPYATLKSQIQAALAKK